MSVAYPPQEHAWFASTLDGKMLMRHSVGEIEIRYSQSAEVAQKNVSKELTRQQQKEAKQEALRMVETTRKRQKMGGYGHWTDDLKDAKHLRQVLRRKEWRTLTGFLKMQRTLERTYIPEAREEIKQKMLQQFETTNYQELKAKLLKGVQADPRCDVLIRGGQVIKTTRKGIEEHAAARNASAEGLPT